MTTYAELDALLAARDELLGLLDDLKPAEWERPTRCAPWTIKQLVCHLASGQKRVNSLVTDKPSEPATMTRLDWWRYDYDAMAPKSRDVAVKDAADRTSEEALAWLRSEYADVESIYADPAAMAGRKGVTLTVGDLASARTLETSVHTMDLGHAAMRGERISKAALPVVVSVLDGLLGEPLPKSIGWDARTYVLTATGRRRLSPNEVVTLKGLAPKFPLLR